MLFAKNQIDNLKEEVEKGIRVKLEQGWLPGKPPVGFITIGDHGHKIHVHHPDKKPLVHEAFELYASGNHSLQSLTTTMDQKGLRTSFGRPIVKSQMHRLLTKPF